MREAGSLGLVIERKRAGSGMQDGLLWFCDHCNAKLHDTYFELRDIEKDFLPRFKEFYGSEEMRTCNSCGEVLPTDPRFVED
jgi:3-hydroxyanthranilate 3,4-dioxygenase